MSATLCQQIKAKLTLREAARLVNVTLPDRDGVKFCSPLRPDKSPSCSIKGDLFTDWSTGQHLDAIDFYATAKGMSTPDAIRELGERYGIAAGSGQSSGKVRMGGGSPAAVTQSETLAVVAGDDLLSDPGEPEDEDFEALRASRLLPEATGGLELAYQVGVLRFGMVCGFPSWVVTDSSNRSAEARRLDGEQYPQSGTIGPRKAHTLRGSKKNWPVGLLPRISQDRLAKLRRAPLVMVEGGPDLIAAYCILARFPMDARDVQPVAMLGVNNAIGDEAMAFMAGRPVVIIVQGDKAGREAAGRWRDQLISAGCSCKRRELPDGKDLNDLLIGRTDLSAAVPYLLP